MIELNSAKWQKEIWWPHAIPISVNTEQAWLPVSKTEETDIYSRVHASTGTGQALILQQEMKTSTSSKKKKTAWKPLLLNS